MRKNSWVWLLYLVLAGCAALGLRSDEAALRARVEARWQAILALDFDRVYQFATPAYRATHSLEHFKNQYAAQVERKGIEIRALRFDPEEPNTAKVQVALRFATSGVYGPVIEGTDYIEETWVKEKGQWWYVEPR